MLRFNLLILYNFFSFLYIEWNLVHKIGERSENRTTSITKIDLNWAEKFSAFKETPQHTHTHPDHNGNTSMAQQTISHVHDAAVSSADLSAFIWSKYLTESMSIKCYNIWNWKITGYGQSGWHNFHWPNKLIKNQFFIFLHGFSVV